RIALARDDSTAEMIMSQISAMSREIKNIENQLNNLYEEKVKPNVDKKNIILFINSLKDFTKNIGIFDDILKKRSLIQTVVKEIIWNDDQYEAHIEFLEDLKDDCK
ncbi:MAG: recombinase family protein, partial [Clostridium sp.]